MDINNIINKLQNSLDVLDDRFYILVYAIEQSPSVSLKFDEFAVIKKEIKNLEEILHNLDAYRKENKENSLSEICASLVFTIDKLNKVFSAKETITENDMSGVIDCVKKVNNLIIKTKLIASIFGDVKDNDKVLEVDNWVNTKYDERRQQKIADIKYNIDYDNKLDEYVEKFKQIEEEHKNKSIPKDKLRLYYKLKSELDALKTGSRNKFISRIRFNYFYNILNRSIKLSKKNSFKQVVVDNKKRK